MSAVLETSIAVLLLSVSCSLIVYSAIRLTILVKIWDIVSNPDKYISHYIDLIYNLVYKKGDSDEDH